MLNTRSGGRGRGDSNTMDQIAATLQALTARMDQQQEMIMQQQQSIKQLYEILAKREQEREQESSVRIEGEHENEPEAIPQASPSQMPPPPPPRPQEQPQVHPPPNLPQLTNTQALNHFKSIIPLSLMGSLMYKKQRHGS